MTGLRACPVLALILASLLTAACGTPEASPPPVAEATTGTTAGFAWAVLPVARGADFGLTHKGYWQPDAATVRAGLARIKDLLHSEGTRGRPGDAYAASWWRKTTTSILAKLSGYRCQVMGFETDEGRRVYLNFVHADNFEPHPDEAPGDQGSWTTDPVCVDDGGDWYWQVWLDPETGTLSDLSVNGEA